jgi:hypothetical protein
MKRYLLVCALVFAPGAAFAQPAIMAPAGVVLPQGTSIRLHTATLLRSQESKVRQIDLQVAEDVMLDGRIIIPRGVPARGTVAMAKKGMRDTPGTIRGRVLALRINGTYIPVVGTVNELGGTGTAGVVTVNWPDVPVTARPMQQGLTAPIGSPAASSGRGPE